MVTEETMRQIRIDVCGMTGQLKSILAHVIHELDLSEKAIKEGMEVRE